LHQISCENCGGDLYTSNLAIVQCIITSNKNAMLFCAHVNSTIVCLNTCDHAWCNTRCMFACTINNCRNSTESTWNDIKTKVFCL